MASPTKKTDLIRKRKARSTNRKRRAANRTNGTTKSAAELFGDDE